MSQTVETPEYPILRASQSFGITPEQYMLPARGEIRMVDPSGRLLAPE